jgi:hypothetical protein
MRPYGLIKRIIPTCRRNILPPLSVFYPEDGSSMFSQKFDTIYQTT